MMKTLIYDGPGQLRFEQAPIPVPAKGEVLIATRAVGICGSDVHAYQASTPRRKPPMIMGHEVSGEVVSVGDDVKDIKVGNRVAVQPVASCQKCASCKNGKGNLCADRVVLGVNRSGAYTEYFTVGATLACQLPDDLSYTQAALAEPLAVAIHAVNKLNGQLPENIAIIGSGVIGLFVLLLLKLAGTKNVIVIDIDDFKLNIAKELGAAVTINPLRDDPKTIIKDKFGGVGTCFEAVGISATVNQAISITNNAGEIVLIGMSQSKMETAMLEVVVREIAMLGSYCYTSQEFEHGLELLASGKIDGSPLISQSLPLSKAITAFEQLSDKNANLLRIVLTN